VENGHVTESKALANYIRGHDNTARLERAYSPGRQDFSDVQLDPFAYLSEMSAPHQVRRELLEMLGLSGECLRLLEDNITPSLYTSPGVQCQLQANAAYSVMRSDYETDDVD
jgi:hypothetical protein